MSEHYNENCMSDQDVLCNYVPDQTVIAKRKVLSHIKSLKYKQHVQEPLPIHDWYPYVNSYYHFTEDVDAYARVNHLIETKQSFTSLRSIFSCKDPSKTDAYSEEDAQLQYLNSKPECFLILGKPGVGQEALGQRLAEYWKCVYIDPLMLLEEAVESGDRSGECIEFNLRCGRAIGVEVIMRLLTKKIQTPAARHRGYVICGFPLVPNDLFQDDPISSESAVFNVREIFEEIIDNTMTDLDRLDVSQGSKTPLKSEAPSTVGSKCRISISEGQSLNKIEDIDLSGDFMCPSNICVRAEMADDSDKQINCLFGLFLEPFVIIYVTCPNPDVIAKRDNYYFDSYSKKFVDIQKVKLFMQVGGDDEDLLRDVSENGDPFDQTFQHFAKVPENLPANVATQLDCYHRSFANLIDQKVLLHDVQFFIKLDGRAFITRMLNIVKTKLRVLPLQKVLVPKRLNISLEAGGEGVELKQDSDLNPEEAFVKLCKRQITAAPFKWTWSNWKTYCPVAMRDSGVCVDGDPDYAVQFMNKIFFLADNDAYLKFLDDPRMYLLPPFPKLSCKVFIFGPPVSGKSALAQCLQFLLDGEILDPKEMQSRYITQKQSELLERFRQSALLEGVKLLDEQRQVSYLAQVDSRNKEIQEWEDQAVDLLGELVQLLERRAEHLDISPFPLKFTDHRLSTDDENFLYESRLATVNLPFIDDKEICLNLINNKDELHKYLPDQLQSEIRLQPATVSESFVQDYANEQCASVPMEDLSMTADRVLEMYIGRIREIEEKNEHSGWIIDGMTTDVILIGQICDVVNPNTVVILQDTADYEFLMKRIEIKFQNRFRDFRQLFLSIGEKDAAWRSPSNISTSTFKHRLAEEILTDIRNTTVEAESEPKSFDKYKEELVQFHNDAVKVLKLFEERNQEVITVTVTDQSIKDLLEEVVNRIKNRLRVGASEFTEGDRAEEVQEMLTANVSTEGEGQKQDYSEVRKYGDTYNYCPVTFSKYWVLWKGKDQFTAKFRNKIYLLSGQDALNKFLHNPRKYLVTDRPPAEFPPPRICVVGVHWSGKTTVSKLLAENLGVRYFSYNDFISSSITDDELENYLTNNEPLSVSEKLVTQLWFDEPMRSLGFVVDDYPKRPCDVDVMTAANAIPDVVIYIAANQSFIYDRLLQRSLEDWSKKMQMERDVEEKRRQEIFQTWESRRQKLHDELMQSKREIRYSEKSRELEQNEGILQSSTQVSFDSVAEQDDDREVTKVLDEELPEPAFSVYWETEDEATDRFRASIEEDYFNEIKFVYDIKASCELHNVLWSEVNGNHSVDKVAAQAFLVADRVKFRNKSLFETCFDVTVENAEKLLDQGYYFLSKFGKTCPVQIYEKFNPVQMFLPMERQLNLFPVIHRQYVYFMAGAKNRKKFVENPLEYTQTQNFSFPLIAFKLAVIGPPKCGKTRLCNRYNQDLGLKVISRGQAARYTLKSLPFSKLAQSMEASLRKGAQLTTQAVMESVQAATIDALALTQGTIFDGFPNTIEEIKVLAKLGLVPNLIIDLTSSDQNIYKFASTIPVSPTPIYSKRFTKHLLKQFKADERKFRVWCDREYQNIFKLPITKCMWGIWEDSKQVTLAVFSEIKHYYTHIQHDWPLRLANMIVTPLEFIERQSRYKSYCPVCWKRSKKLSNGGEPPDRTGLVHYRNYFYWTCQEHIEEFLKVPEDFMPPASTYLPPNLPSRIRLNQRPDNLCQDGLCLVCYIDNQPEKILNEGNLRYGVGYNHKIYLFDSEECLNKFLATPDQYFETTINFKQTVSYTSLSRENLPILGFLEQFVAQNVVKAVNHVAIYRPVIPGLSVSVSGLVGIGLHLKVFNEKAPKKHLQHFEDALEKFHLRRKRLISSLDQMKTCLNPRLGFEPNLVVTEYDGRSGSLSSDGEV